MLDIKALLAKVAATIPADYIVEEGTSGDWTYRKWQSGIVEAWSKALYFSNVSGSAWGNLYYYEHDVSIPSGIFSTAPNHVYLTGSGRQWWVVGYSSATTTKISSIRFVRPASSAATAYVTVYAVYTP